jgi:predicted dehydrogenase
LCEKPIAVNYHEFCQLKELAAETNCVLLEDHNYRFHSAIRRIGDLLKAGELGDVVDVQIFFSLDVLAPGYAWMDKNAPDFRLALRGGLIGDFLTHIAYLAHMFTGPVIDLQTAWRKHVRDSALPADEFRAFLRGERTTAYVAFSGNAQPDGFWVRVAGTRMHAETNLLEPPRLTLRRRRAGEPALAKLIDGVSEARDVLKGTMAGFWRKLSGVSKYDGLAELVRRVYLALERQEPAPISLQEIDEAARLVDRLSQMELKL